MRKKTTKTIKNIYKSLQKGSTISQSCRNSNISTNTFYSWYSTDKRFAKLVEKAKESRVQIVEDALHKNAREGNTQAQIFFLKNRRKDRWTDTVEHKGLNINIIQAMKEARERLKEDKQAVLESKGNDNRVSGVL